MAQNSLVEDDQSFNLGSDENGMDIGSMGDSPPYPEDPAANILPPSRPQPFVPNPSKIPPQNRAAAGFHAISMDAIPQKKVLQDNQPSGGGRLLMRKTIAKANGSPVDAHPEISPTTSATSLTKPSYTTGTKLSEVKPELTHAQPLSKPIETQQKVSSPFDLFTKLPPVPPPGAAAQDPPLPFPVANPEIPPAQPQPQPQPFVPEPTTSPQPPFVPEPPKPVTIPAQETEVRPESSLRQRSQTMPQHSSIPAQQVPQFRATEPKEIPRPQATYQFSLESGFMRALERSFASVRRIFSKEFSSFIRSQPQHQGTSSIDFDDFTDRLTNEIEQVIMSPVLTVDLNQQQLARRISSILSEHTKPMTAILADVEARNATAAEQHIIELRQLHDEIESLHSGFKANTDTIVKELECERQNAISLQGYESARVRELEARMNSLRLKQVELETRAAHQHAERDNLDRTAKHQLQKRRDWEDERFSQSGRHRSTIRQRILQEIKLIKDETDQETPSDLNTVFEECLRMVKQESDNMRGDIVGLEMSNRLVMAKMQQNSAILNSSVRQSRSRSSVIHEAQRRIDQLRRQRESNIR